MTIRDDITHVIGVADGIKLAKEKSENEMNEWNDLQQLIRYSNDGNTISGLWFEDNKWRTYRLKLTSKPTSGELSERIIEADTPTELLAIVKLL